MEVVKAIVLIVVAVGVVRPVKRAEEKGRILTRDLKGKKGRVFGVDYAC